MPLFEYKCVKCGHRFEKIEGHNASETKKCPKCGAKAERQISASAIQFKGTGWYVTDYGGKSGNAPSSESSGDGESKKAGDKGAETKPSADKSEKSDKPDKSEKPDKSGGKKKK